MSYGVCYTGSKNKIAAWVVNNLPYSPVFVDLFAGGCSITHYSMLIGKYPKYIINDLGLAPDLFLSAINGELDNETRWIDRETFHANKETDAYIRYVWSFGNGGMNYVYGENKEAYKKALHYSRVLGDDSLLKDVEVKDSALETLARLKRLQNMKILKNLKTYESIDRLRLDYKEVNIPEATFYYADPPYRSSVRIGNYGQEFDANEFDEWLAKIDKPVIVSEYDAPKGTTMISSIEKLVTVNCYDNSTRKTEGLFIQDRYVDWYKEQMQECKLVLDI